MEFGVRKARSGDDPRLWKEEIALLLHAQHGLLILSGGFFLLASQLNTPERSHINCIDSLNSRKVALRKLHSKPLSPDVDRRVLPQAYQDEVSE